MVQGTRSPYHKVVYVLPSQKNQYPNAFGLYFLDFQTGRRLGPTGGLS